MKITELAQRMKAAAVRAKTATEEYASGHMSVSVCFAECEEFNRLTDEPDNIIALVEALEKAQQRITQLESRTVKLPKPKNSDQGWKIDPEFINKVQDAIGYDDTCECWEGTPSMELVEAVLLAAADIKVEAE
ncbi:hypothetical protein QIH38_11580 [Klebsiella pneumoniae]|nr:hypothetical protein [Klebsiella pneumoniae]MDH8492871.1 hypothetical protein [Klebsiella pneumoniae]MDH8552400.1 hypothetical protein [Klebsiella pneumoniae]MDH8599283.1 hypothetical protein [Klebsiella pneumoniae]